MSNENDIGGKVGLDVTNFKAGIAELNRQIKVIDSGFKAAAAGMDGWGKSEEGLRSRISSLNQITDLQRQKVANLTSEYERVAAEKGENSRAAQDLMIRINKETEALNKNISEINRSQTALDSLGDEFKQTASDVQKLEEASDDASDGLSELGGSVSKAAAAGIAAIAAAATAAIGGLAKFEFAADKAMNKFQAQTGASAAEMEEFRDVAEDIYTSNLGDSIEDVASAMASVKQVTQQSGEELKATTKHALLLRDTFGYEVSESIRTVNTMMKQFKISSDEAYTLIAQGAQKGADKNGDLLDTLNEYSVQFKSLGFSAEEFTDVLIQGAENGAWSIDKVGDAIKEFNIRSKDMSESSKEGFEALGLNADQMFKAFAAGGEQAQTAFTRVMDKLANLDEQTRNTVGVQLFGTQFEDLEADAILALGNIQSQTDSTAGTLKEINDIQYSDILSALEGLKRELITNIAGPIGEKLKPAIGDLIKTVKNFDVTPIVNGLTWIIDNAGTIAAAAVAIGAGMAAWNVTTMIQGVIAGMSAWRAATQGMTIAQAALNLVMSLNPIGLIVTVVAALVAGIIALWHTNDGFREAVIAAWDAIKAAAVAVWEWLVKFFTEDIPNAFKALLDWFKRLPQEVRTRWNEVIASIRNFGAQFQAWITTEIPKFINKIINFYAQLPGRIWSILLQVINKVKTWTSNLITTAQTEIPKFITKVLQFFGQLPGKMLDIGKDIVRGLWDGIKNMTGWIKDRVSGFASDVVGGIKDALGIHSPSRVMRDEVGKMIGAGMAEGITASTREVDKAMSSLNNQVQLSPHQVGGWSSGGSGGDLAFTVPVYLDGKQIASVNSRHQYSANRSRARAAGVIV